MSIINNTLSVENKIRWVFLRWIFQIAVLLMIVMIMKRFFVRSKL